MCISVWLSPSLGLRSHPPHAVLFPFIIFSLLLFSAPHISLDMPKCLASIMYRNLSLWPQTWSLPCDTTPLYSSNTPTFLSSAWAKKLGVQPNYGAKQRKINYCWKSNHIWWANQRTNCTSNWEHVECITSTIIMHLLAGCISAQAPNSWVRLCSLLCKRMLVWNVQQWGHLTAPVQNVRQQWQRFLWSPDLYRGLIHVEGQNIFCRGEGNELLWRPWRSF